jgi:hypothetical protein
VEGRRYGTYDRYQTEVLLNPDLGDRGREAARSNESLRAWLCFTARSGVSERQNPPTCSFMDV